MSVNILNKPLIYLCLFLSLTTFSFGYASYRFYGQKKVAQSQVITLEAANKDYADKLELIEKAYVIGDKIALDVHKNNASIEAVGQGGLEEIDALDRCFPAQTEDLNRSIKQEVGVNENSKKNVANIDDKLPDEFSRSLFNTYNSLQDRSSVGDATK